MCFHNKLHQLVLFFALSELLLGNMVGRRWLPWINNPSPGSITVTSDKQEGETSSGFLGNGRKGKRAPICPVVGVSVLCLLLLLLSCGAAVYNAVPHSGPEWNGLLLENQNISGGLLTRANHLLEERGLRLQEQTGPLSADLRSADLRSADLALSLASAELAERIANLTSANLRLAWERERLLPREAVERNHTARRLLDSEEEGPRLSGANGLLGEELLREREENRRLRGEVEDLSHQLTQLQEQKRDMESVREAFRSLDLYCPVVTPWTKERICRKCPDSWRLFENKCYFFSSQTLTWSSSRAWCRTQGGDLLIVNSQAEQSFVFQSGPVPQPSCSRLWMGLSDREEEGEWRWVDGTRVLSEVQFWLSRPGLGPEPDDWKLDDPRGEDCGLLDASEQALGSWMDGSCEESYRWICEKNV
ncbi:asialoglycoprotein receptor 1-like [Pungitius pungitius]|uniref:asialoglycoprotein receptor 1-like n=1 Tax=Pungitius pungitius TaxID=134920 RepID=UPI002E160ABA